MDSYPSFRGIRWSVFFISAALIAYEIILVRLFSIQYWHHFAYLIISTALLGFGTSGTFIVLFKNILKKKALLVFVGLPPVITGFFWVNLFISRKITFNPLLLLWQSGEILNLVVLIASLFVPFFLGAVCVGMGFVLFPEKIHDLYSANLVGSGLGSLVVLSSVLHVTPVGIILMISIMMIAACFCAVKTRGQRVLPLIILTLTIAVYLFLSSHAVVVINPYKDLARVQTMSGSVTEFQKFGSFGVLTVIDNPAYHYMPDLSLQCPFSLPDQKGLFLNGNTVDAITGFSGDPEMLKFMECRTASLAYRLFKNPHVLIIGGGGGTEILNASYHQARRITVVEMNKEIVGLLQHQYRDYSGDIYNPENYTVITEEGRGYLKRTDQRFDLIQMSVSGSMETVSSGVYSLNENYLMTTESLESCIDHLNENGMISLTLWVRSPPRESLKLMAMAVDALESCGRDAAKSLIMIRSWQAATLLLKNGDFTEHEIADVKEFCGDRGFDRCYHWGIKEDETNVINQMNRNYFFEAAQKLLHGKKGELYAGYVFDIRPATDNKPFFAHFFKIDNVIRYVTSGERTLIPFIDWGYALLWLTMVILIVFSGFFILAPLPGIGRNGPSKLFILVYFGSLGLAYMFLEISLVQKYIRYLHDPVYSATVVIASFLVFSGMGSMLGGKISAPMGRSVPVAAAVIIIAGIVYLFADPVLEGIMSGLPLGLRLIVCAVFIAPLAVPMGIPFPAGLAKVGHGRKELIPWAWGINGFFSVVGVSGGAIIAIGYGFSAVIICALILYGIAAVADRVPGCFNAERNRLFAL